ncbi:sigma-E factor negative regulatory protein [Chitinimonas sp. BJYL2]|uniref:sigma-E factor negative regulatory protein n=1 Tax=Chitinimonas sp. BJYL2 TaxID=2976696 RepID=UPI0022B4F693|nr:RseA family anti-sigma factor [Chitinimonas sp. BJYL2]
MQDKVSAMMDGEWDDHELDAVLQSMKQDPDCADSWQTYHLIGDAMNACPGLPDDFMDRFSARLADEPAILAPNAMRRPHRAMPGKRWVAVSMAASVALVSATAWYVGGARGVAVSPTQMVAAPMKAPRVQGEAVNPYLVAHQAMLGNPGYVHRPVILSGAEAERVNGQR